MDLHAGHWLRRCKYCRTVITQCRCMGLKGTVWSVCDKDDCKARFAKESRAESADAELARLRAENERLRGLFSEKRRTEVEWDMVERRLSYYTIPEDDELLAALDQERKEGDR